MTLGSVLQWASSAGQLASQRFPAAFFFEIENALECSARFSAGFV